MGDYLSGEGGKLIDVFPAGTWNAEGTYRYLTKRSGATAIVGKALST